MKSAFNTKKYCRPLSSTILARVVVPFRLLLSIWQVLLLKNAGIHYNPGWREALWELSVLPKNTTQWCHQQLQSVHKCKSRKPLLMFFSVIRFSLVLFFQEKVNLFPIWWIAQKIPRYCMWQRGLLLPVATVTVVQVCWGNRWSHPPRIHFSSSL